MGYFRSSRSSRATGNESFNASVPHEKARHRQTPDGVMRSRRVLVQQETHMRPNEMVYIVDDDARAGEALSPLLRGGPGAPKAALCRRSTSRNLHHWAEKPVQGT